jgi:MinD-like ATPase involved in chromosome partitioning or flagellar assembly/CheY-like chemotaxis protein
MLCLIAVEENAASVIRDNLIDSGLYPGWEFPLCNNAKELVLWNRNNVDVLLLSRFLPGEDSLTLLSRLRSYFPSTHIVLLAGNESEQRRNYIKAAHRYGFDNIVTGKLPGDRPYNIFNALTSHKEFLDGLEQEEPEEEPPALKEEPPVPRGLSDTERPGAGNDQVENDEKSTGQAGENIAGENPEPADAKDDNNGKSDKAEELSELLLRLIKSSPEDLERLVLGRQSTQPNKPEQRPLALEQDVQNVNEFNHGSGWNRQHHYNNRGILVLTASNKGGVGKTTVAVSLVSALARFEIPAAIADFDLGSPDVAAFFNIKGVPGIEKLAGRILKPHMVEEILVQKNGINILPGPMDKTFPQFKKGQLAEIARILTSRFPVVVGDTPPEYWTKPWLRELFEISDLIIAVVDQSKFSEQETRDYAPYLLSMGVAPEKIRIVLNRFNPKLHNVRIVEKHFCSGFKKSVKTLPKVVAMVPEDWLEHVLKGYKGEVVGLNEEYGCWHKIAEEVATLAGVSYVKPVKERKGFKFKLFGGAKK